MSEYALIKLIHLGALVFWLGPPLGAWLILKVVEKDTECKKQTLAKVNAAFYLMIALEHVAFIVLVITGFLLAHKYQLMDIEWLKQKLYIVFIIIIPLEIIDVMLGNLIASRVSQKIFSSIVVTPWEERALRIYRGPFTKLALIVVPLAVAVIMYLAISKTAFAF